MPKRDLLPLSLSNAEDPTKALDAAGDALAKITGETNHMERLATLGTLAAGVVHEINNVLTPVLAYAQMAATKPADQALLVKALEKTILGVETATRIADAILGFAGHSDENEADVGRVVQASLECLARDPNKDQIAMQIEVQPGTTVRMNPLSLQQVLMNLLLNAHAAMSGEHGTGHRGGRLTVAAITRADGTVGIRVSDTGPGIPKEIAGRIFEPFVTSKRAAATGSGLGTSGKSGGGGGGGGGSGLGLAICRRLVEQAGGSITASSVPGQGTTFLVILPSPKSRRAKAG